MMYIYYTLFSVIVHWHSFSLPANIAVVFLNSNTLIEIHKNASMDFSLAFGANVNAKKAL